jgi:hypothetical protein
MPTNDPSTLFILIVVALALLGLLVAMALEILRRLARIERRVTEISSGQDEANDAASSSETLPGGAFETFLGEEPARRSLPKAEKFAAYRKWRQENGLNWPMS